MISSRTAIFRRSNALSPGAIAGAVVGSVLGGGLLVIILGFLYFRYRRRCRAAQAEEGLSAPKAPAAYHGVPLPWHGPPLSQTTELRNGRAPGGGDEYSGGTVPVRKMEPSTQMSPLSPYGEDWLNGHQNHALQNVGFDTLPQDIDFSMPGRQHTFPLASEPMPTIPLNHASTAPEAANSSYYDMRISMDSDPVGPNTPPSRQMSEMYRAQLEEAERHRRSNSFPKRIWNAVSRRQSSRQTNGTVHETPQSPLSQQPVGQSFTEYPVPIKQEPDQKLPSETGWQGMPIGTHLVAEPEEIPEGAPSSGPFDAGPGREGDYQPQTQHKMYRDPTGDSQYGGFPSRIDSTIREKLERDPALPSSVLNPDSTYGLPLEAQPQSPIEKRERLKSPEIPEPMDVDGLQLEDNRQSPFRLSHSPQLSSDFTINPMAILHPTNSAEQAAYTTYQIKHSVSPPPMPSAVPDITTQKPKHEDNVGSPPKDEDFAMYLDLPSDDDNRRSSDSYEYPSTPEQSSAAESSGRTPDTRPTVSPLPFPTIPEYSKPKPDPDVSPSSIKPPPQSGPLVCPECGREFDQIHKLNHHKRYHDRTHECTYPGCDRKFGTKTHLDRHINDRHLKLKTYHCTEPTCAWFKGGKSFPRKDNWRRHMMKKHGTTAQDFDNMEPS
ncbi:hypothetical protein F4861DRAFT_264656 [Xylaria intraflava]|nr:hypothetical protein F4861DRAFT_264656 [Xylaria intraflava]